MLFYANLVDRISQVLSDVKFVECYSLSRFWHMQCDSLDVGLPHIHSDTFNTGFLLCCQGLKVLVEYYPLYDCQLRVNNAFFVVRNHGDVLMPLLKRGLVNG